MKIQRPIQGFVDFIRERGVVGLAVGFVIGTAVTKLVTSFVSDIISPIIGISLGKLDLESLALTVGKVKIKWGDFVSSFIDFIIIVAVIYLILKFLKLEKLEVTAKKKIEEDKEEK